MEDTHNGKRLIDKLKTLIELSQQPSSVEPDTNMPFLNTLASIKRSCVDIATNTLVEDPNPDMLDQCG